MSARTNSRELLLRSADSLMVGIAGMVELAETGDATAPAWDSCRAAFCRRESSDDWLLSIPEVRRVMVKLKGSCCSWWVDEE